MERITRCHLCASTRHKFLFQQRDLFHNIPGEFSVWECENCGLVFLNPRPTVDELMDFYPESYVAYTKPLEEEKKLKRIDRSYGLRKRFRFVKKIVKSGRILDVGCATGAFLTELYELEPTEWELYGVEPNSSAASIAQQWAFLKVSADYLESVAYSDNFFDVVTLWDVLEHLPDPLATLYEIRRILKPQGALIFSVPNLDSWDAAIFGPYWVGYDVPRHIHVFNQRTLTRLLRKAGFDEQSRACVAGSYFYFVSSLIFLLHAKLTEHWFTRWLEQSYALLPIRLMVAPYFWLSDRFRKSTTITLACRAA